MTDTRDHRHAARCHRASEPLVVERHEILIASAAADEEDDVHIGLLGHLQAMAEFPGSGIPFDGDAAHAELGDGETTAQGTDAVMDGFTAWRGHDGDPGGQDGQRALARRIHEPLLLQLARQRGYPHAQIALAGELERADREVHPPLGDVGGERTGDLDQQARPQLDIPTIVDVAPHQTGHGGPLVVQREVHGLVAGFVGKFGDFSDDPHRERLEVALDGGHRLGDGQRRVIIDIRRPIWLPGTRHQLFIEPRK